MNSHVAKIMATRPTWAKGIVLASLVEDRSEMQTDYHGSATTRTVAIGWRKSAREDFRALRKAAATFGPTAHLAPGCDDYCPMVVLCDNVISNGAGHWEGSYSHWHGDLYGTDGVYSHDAPHFSTEAAAQAFIAAAGEPHPITFQTPTGAQEVRFAWRIERTTVEHRENYSMGGGNYLKSGYRHDTGWKVFSRDIRPDGAPSGYAGDDDIIEAPEGAA